MFNKLILLDNPVMTTVQRKSKLRRFVQLDGADKWLLLRAARWLAIARIRLATTPFARLAEQLSAEPGAADTEADPELLRRIGNAVRAAANNVPWRSDCFPQAIAAHALLRRRGYQSTFHIGVERVGEDALHGHAWLTCGEIVVTGGEDLHRYTEIHLHGEKN